MAKKWYPVIDYSECLECGSCIRKCTHSVYDMKKAPVPVVLMPDYCIDRCHGCGNICPVGAIEYVGDDTGWTPKAKQTNSVEKSTCSCGSLKKVIIEYLYLDQEVCDRCIDTEEILKEAIDNVSEELEKKGFEVIYRKTQIENQLMATKFRFVSSPTIRINGYDIFSTVYENECGCCSSIASESVKCRAYEYEGEVYDVPTVEMVSESILKQIESCCDIKRVENKYVIPENLLTFFEGKDKSRSNGCNCGKGCTCG